MQGAVKGYFHTTFVLVRRLPNGYNSSRITGKGDSGW
jgi:hypothetical protein